MSQKPPYPITSFLCFKIKKYFKIYLVLNGKELIMIQKNEILKTFNKKTEKLE